MASPQSDLQSTFQETRSAIRATPAWVGHAVQSLVGSRFFVGVSGIFFISFLSHVTSAPDRLPPFRTAHFMSVMGFAPNVGAAPALPTEVSDQARSAADAGIPYVTDFVDGFVAGHPQAITHANIAGLTISAICLLIGLYMLARQESRKH